MHNTKNLDRIDSDWRDNIHMICPIDWAKGEKAISSISPGMLKLVNKLPTFSLALQPRPTSYILKPGTTVETALTWSVGYED